MFRRAFVFCLAAMAVLAFVTDVDACHRCRAKRGGSIYGAGCGYQCHSGQGRSYKIVKVYRTVKVPVQTCSTSCVAICDPCNPCATTMTPVQTCTTSYVTQRQLVHTQVVPSGSIYGRYNDGSHRLIYGGYGHTGRNYGGAGYGGYGYGAGRTPYRTNYGIGGGYPMGGYGAAKPEAKVVAYKAIAQGKLSEAKPAGLAF